MKVVKDKSKTLIILRKPRYTGNFSLESITDEISNNFIENNLVLTLPYFSNSLIKILINILWVAFKSFNFDKILITGDIYYAAVLCKREKVTAIFHDTYILKNSKGLKYYFYYYLYYKVPLLTYNKIIVVSKFSMIELNNICKRKYFINHPLLALCKQEYIDKNIDRNIDYISIGSAPNKRFDLVERIALNESNKSFVHIGKQSSNLNNVQVINGKIDNLEMCNLYQSSKNLLFLSDFEGFGMPLVEALYFGCNVFFSDLEVFKEILTKLSLNYIIDEDKSKYIGKKLLKVHYSKNTFKKVNIFLKNNHDNWISSLNY